MATRKQINKAIAEYGYKVVKFSVSGEFEFWVLDGYEEPHMLNDYTIHTPLSKCTVDDIVTDLKNRIAETNAFWDRLDRIDRMLVEAGIRRRLP